MGGGTSVTAFGGVARIGGNSLLLEHGASRIILDFGKDFEQYRRFFEFPFILPRRSVTRELLKTEILPRLRSATGQPLPIYVESEDRKVLEPRDHNPLLAVYVTHAHLDHCGFLPVLRSDLPLYMGAIATQIFATGFETRRDTTLENRLYWKAGAPEQDRTPRITMQAYHSRHSLQADGFTLTPWPVDHSIPGAYAFIVDTPDARLAYTGDFRSHGPAARLTERFADELAADPPDVLITEGTNLNQGRAESEEHVAASASELFRRSFNQGNRLVLVELRSSDLDRLSIFLRLARRFDCDVAVGPRLAYLLERLHDRGLATRLFTRPPRPGRDVRVLNRQRTYQEAWELALLDRVGDVLEAEAIRQPRKRTVVLDGARFNVFEYQAPPGTLYIQSTSEHMAEEEEFGEERFVNALALHGILVYRVHSSGHAPPLALIDLIRRARPRTLIPIHTEHPETFVELFRQEMQVVLPEKGVPIELGAQPPQ